MKKKILIVTDTTDKQVNGVVRTLSKTIQILEETFEVFLVNPASFRTLNLPDYPEIEFSLDLWKVKKYIESINPDFIHIATEGPLGLFAKLYCDYKKYNYTTSYHSKFPEFIEKMYKVPSNLTYPYFKWFHSKSSNVLVPTNIVKNLLESKGFKKVVIWKRGVDTKLFNQNYRLQKSNTKIILCVSRVSKEKGLDDFCSITPPVGFIKILIGDGPYLEELKSKYTDVEFLGKKLGEDLVFYYSNADVFIFPSKEDTFGLTQLESIACGTPVLAYKGTVSEEIIKEGKTGYLVETFDKENITKASLLNRKNILKESLNWDWRFCTDYFIKYLVEK